MVKVILLDNAGNSIGEEEKLAAHMHGGQLHLAFSILVFNRRNGLLLQKRAAAKYHFAGLWSNTCCGHPQPHEGLIEAAERRLHEEFGFTVPLHESFRFQYEAHDDNSGLTERELLCVLMGRYDGEPVPNPREIEDWSWQRLDEVTRESERTRGAYTPWFRLILRKLARMPGHGTDRLQRKSGEWRIQLPL